MKKRKKSSDDKNSPLSKLSMIYGRLCRENRLNFFLHYAKTSIFHVAFEAVLTVLYIAPLVIYPVGVDSSQRISLSLFFGRVLLSCAMIFTFVICSYSFFLCFCCMLAVVLYKKQSYSFWKQIRRVTLVGISSGFVLYVVGGFFVSRKPDVFAGMKTPNLSPQQQSFIWLMITVFGGLWAVLSLLRFFQFNIKADTISSQLPDDGVCCQSVNQQSLLISILSKVTQIVIICIVGVFLFSTIRFIPQEESFNYYNLVLLIYFGALSTYATLCYKLEISRNFPDMSICTNISCQNRKSK